MIIDMDTGARVFYIIGGILIILWGIGILIQGVEGYYSG